MAIKSRNLTYANPLQRPVADCMCIGTTKCGGCVDTQVHFHFSWTLAAFRLFAICARTQPVVATFMRIACFFRYFRFGAVLVAFISTRNFVGSSFFAVALCNQRAAFKHPFRSEEVHCNWFPTCLTSNWYCNRFNNMSCYCSFSQIVYFNLTLPKIDGFINWNESLYTHLYSFTREL